MSCSEPWRPPHAATGRWDAQTADGARHGRPGRICVDRAVLPMKRRDVEVLGRLWKVLEGVWSGFMTLGVAKRVLPAYFLKHLESAWRHNASKIKGGRRTKARI